MKNDVGRNALKRTTRETIIAKLQVYTKNQGIIFTSHTDSVEYYRGLVEIIEDLISESNT